MKKQVFLCLCCVLLVYMVAFAEEHKSKHFIIKSDLDTRYVQFVQANAEAYYENLAGRYFQVGWQAPLTIYYSGTQSETQRLLDEQGCQTKVDHGCCVAGMPAVYTHQFMDNGERNGWGPLFGEITHHFIQLNLRDAPQWLTEGLSCFFGEQGHIVKGKLIMGELNSERAQILKERLDEGRRWNITRLFSARAEQFFNSDEGRAFTQVFFDWLYETGQLEQYLRSVREKGYELSVLEGAVSRTYGKINVELSRFLKENCDGWAYLGEGRRAGDEALKKEAFLKALELKPDCSGAQMELAKCCCRSKDYEKCGEYLKEILDEPEGIEYQRAAGLMGDACYKEKNYSEALGYYNKAWEYSDYYEYKYRVAYRIGNCYHYLEDPESAKQWYEKFLDCNWEPESTEGMKKQVEHARKYIEWANRLTGVRQSGRGEDTKENCEKRP